MLKVYPGIIHSESDGYWIEDEIDTKQVIKIAVFIKEVLDYDLFEKYEWC